MCLSLHCRRDFPVHVWQSSLEPPEVLLGAHSQLEPQSGWEQGQFLPGELQVQGMLYLCSLWILEDPLSSPGLVQLHPSSSQSILCCLFEQGTLLLLSQSLADIACSYEQMLCGCEETVGETGSVCSIDKEQNGGLFKLCTDNFSIIKGAADSIPCLQMK